MNQTGLKIVKPKKKKKKQNLTATLFIFFHLISIGTLYSPEGKESQDLAGILVSVKQKDSILPCFCDTSQMMSKSGSCTEFIMVGESLMLMNVMTIIAN